MATTAACPRPTSSSARTPPDTLSRLPPDVTAEVLGFLPITDIANVRVCSRSLRTAADGPALWTVLVRSRAGVRHLRPSPRASGAPWGRESAGVVPPTKAFARHLCLGATELDGEKKQRGGGMARGGHDDDGHRVATSSRTAGPLWTPLMQCSAHGHFISARSRSATPLAEDAEVVDDAVNSAAHTRSSQLPVAVSAVIVPSLDAGTLALAEGALASITGVEVVPPSATSAQGAPPPAPSSPLADDARSSTPTSSLYEPRRVPALGGAFEGVPARFPSVSLYSVHARRPTVRHLAASQSIKSRLPAEVRCVTLFVAIPAVTDSGMAPSAVSPTAAGANGEDDDWVDEPAVAAAAGRVLVAALVCASNVVVVNGARVMDWVRWHGLLRRATRAPSWELPVLATRRDNATTMTYITVPCAGTPAPRTSASASTDGANDTCSPRVLGVFDPLLDLFADRTQQQQQVYDDPDWVVYGFVNKAATVSGFIVSDCTPPASCGKHVDPQPAQRTSVAATSNAGNDAAGDDASELLSDEYLREVMMRRCPGDGDRTLQRHHNAAPAATTSSRRRAALLLENRLTLPPEVSDVVGSSSARPFLLPPLTHGAALGGLHNWPEVAVVIEGTMRKATNPAANFGQIIARDILSTCFEPLITAAIRFYATAMAIEIDDAARPNSTFWINATAEAHRVAAELDRAYTVPTSPNVSRMASGRASASAAALEEDDELQDEGDGAAVDGGGEPAHDVVDEEAEAQHPDAEVEATLDDFVPITPAELLTTSDLASVPTDPATASPAAVAQTPPSLPERTTAALFLPMEVDQLLDAHERFSAAAMRQLLHSMCSVSDPARGLGPSEITGPSVDSQTGREMVERMKQMINTRFRVLWGENQVRSRTYCEAVAARVFSRLRNTFTNADATGLKHPSGTRRWYACVRACIEEYVVRAIGGRTYDVLATYVLSTVVEEFRAACRSHNIADQATANLCADSVANEVAEMHRRHVAERDSRVGKRQMIIAQLCVFITNEWSALSASADINKLATDLHPDVIADWSERTQDTLLRLRAGGVRAPESIARPESEWLDLAAQMRGFLHGRYQEATTAMHAIEHTLHESTSEAHNTSAVKAREREEREENATGVVRIFNRLARGLRSVANHAVNDDGDSRGSPAPSP